MTQRYRVSAEFDVVVPTGSEEAATQIGEQAIEAWKRGSIAEGMTWGSRDGSISDMLSQPRNRGSLLAITLLGLGQDAAGGSLSVENLKMEPVSQHED